MRSSRQPWGFLREQLGEDELRALLDRLNAWTEVIRALTLLLDHRAGCVVASIAKQNSDSDSTWFASNHKGTHETGLRLPINAGLLFVQDGKTPIDVGKLMAMAVESQKLEQKAKAA